jgi:hypothetical protein
VGIHGIEPHLERFKADHDDYSDILLKALADRFAEAFAEALHAHVRRDLWAYAAGEQLTNEALIREQYRGIRPAPGYPACPDHTLKPILFDLLNAGENAGLVLTESQAMLPTAAVSGFYFAHPESQYFGVATIGEDNWPIMPSGADRPSRTPAAGCGPIWIDDGAGRQNPASIVWARNRPGPTGAQSDHAGADRPSPPENPHALDAGAGKPPARHIRSN